jgi:hypothetical protein
MSRNSGGGDRTGGELLTGVISGQQNPMALTPSIINDTAPHILW